MKENLISLLVEKVGLDQQKAEQSVAMIADYVKSNPQKLTSYLESAGGGGIAKTFGGMLGRHAGEMIRDGGRDCAAPKSW